MSTPGTHFTAETTEAMRIKCLSQRHNILIPGFEPSTSVSRNRHSNHMTNMLYTICYNNFKTCYIYIYIVIFTSYANSCMPITIFTLQIKLIYLSMSEKHYWDLNNIKRNKPATSTLVTGTTTATFSSFEVKEFIINSAPKSCDLDSTHSKLLVECQDSILPYLTDLFNSSLASDIFSNASNQPLTYLFSKRGVLTTMI